MADPESRYEAWKHMRPSPKGKSAYAAASAAGASNTGARETKAPPPEPRPNSRPTTRSASQRHKAEASFGTRRATGYVPRSPAGDEPPAGSTNNYSTTRMHTSIFNDISASARRTRRTPSNADATKMFRDSFLDSRQSTPYQTHGGEKLNPFAGAANLGRAKSTRDGSRKDDCESESTPKVHRRSSSMPEEPESHAAHTSDDERSRRGQDENPGPFSEHSSPSPSPSRFSQRYKPSQKAASATDTHSSTSPNGAAG